MATQVSDRFGNWVRYTYDPAHPSRLTRIESSDGRVITLGYTSGRVSSANDGTGITRYEYTSEGRLRFVIRPDNSRWTFNLAGLAYPFIEDVGQSANCEFFGYIPSDEMAGTMTHPSGAEGRFTTAFQVHGRTFVDRYCHYLPDSTTLTTGAVYPKHTASQSLVAKTISGPGMQPMHWSYGYGYAAGWKPCANCTDRKAVIVQGPDGSRTRHVFGIKWRVNEGQLLQTDEGWNGTTALRTTTYRYRLPNSTANR